MELRTRPEDQSLPIINEFPVIQEMVIEDIRKRMEVGIARYGTPLQPLNGRHTLQDLYEELLDGAQYVRSLMWLQEAKREDLVSAVTVQVQQEHPGIIGSLEQTGAAHVAEIAVDAIFDAIALCLVTLPHQ